MATYFLDKIDQFENCYFFNNLTMIILHPDWHNFCQKNICEIEQREAHINIKKCNLEFS